MASNPRRISTNVGKNAGQVAREQLANRRANPGSGVPRAPENNHAGIRARNILTQGKQQIAQGQGAAAPVPPERNAADRAIERLNASRQSRQQRGQ